jgi:hypothetical protein
MPFYVGERGKLFVLLKPIIRQINHLETSLSIAGINCEVFGVSYTRQCLHLACGQVARSGVNDLLCTSALVGIYNRGRVIRATITAERACRLVLARSTLALTPGNAE